MKDGKVLMNLEERLRADHDGSLQAELVKRLKAIQTRLEGEKKKLHKLESFKSIEAGNQAVQAALISLQLFETAKK
jgi:hypothetical protein